MVRMALQEVLEAEMTEALSAAQYGQLIKLIEPANTGTDVDDRVELRSLRGPDTHGCLRWDTHSCVLTLNLPLLLGKMPRLFGAHGRIGRSIGRPSVSAATCTPSGARRCAS